MVCLVYIEHEHQHIALLSAMERGFAETICGLIEKLGADYKTEIREWAPEKKNHEGR